MSPAQKRGLGRGLGALLGNAPVPVTPAQHSDTSIRLIPVDRIRPNPHQPRKHFDEEALAELRASIEEHGVLVPILVREHSGGYELIAGERRWRACASLHRADVPAIVRAMDDRESLEAAIIENLQRENLNPLEEAAGIAQLLEAHAFTQEFVAQRLGKSRPAITNALRLLTLPEPIKALIAKGRMSAGHARALLGAPETARLLLAQRVADEGLSVRALEKIIAALGAPASVKVARPRADAPNDREFEARMRVRFGAPVTLRRSGIGGTIEVRYSGEEDLIRIAQILLGDDSA
jgi:ParB family chromosome partitioning protein